MKTFFKKRRFTLLTRPVKIFKSYKCFIFKYLGSNYENIRECKLSLTYIRKYKGECKSMKTRIFTFFMYSKNKKKHDLTFWLNFVMETEYNLISLKSWITWRICCLLKFVIFFLLKRARACVCVCVCVCVFILFHLLVSSGCTTSLTCVRSLDQRSFFVSILGASAKFLQLYL